MTKTPSTERVLEDVRRERTKQDDKWGTQNHGPTYWLAIFAEEFGEAAKEVVELQVAPGREEYLRRLDLLREELVQASAVAIAFIESLDRNEMA